MKRIYSCPDPLQVNVVAAFLETRGFRVIVRGEERMSTAGGVPPLECWPEIQLIDEDRVDEALAAIKEFSTEPSTPPEPWTCPTCGETIEGQFTECWRCQVPVEPEPPAKRTRTGGSVFALLVVTEIVLSLAIDRSLASDRAHAPAALRELAASAAPPSEAMRALGTIFVFLRPITWIGLLVFRDVARWLFLFLWGMSVVYAMTVPWYCVSGPTMALIKSAAVVGGAILALAFAPPARLPEQPVRSEPAGSSMQRPTIRYP